MKNKLKEIGKFVYTSLNKPGRRVISLLLACALFLAQIPTVTAEGTGEDGTGSDSAINVSAYSTYDLYIYNSIHFLHTDGTQGTNTASSYTLTSTSSTGNKDVYIGDYHDTVAGNIKIFLDDLHLTDSDMYVNKVYDGNYSVEMTVSSDSELRALTIMPGATLTLTVQADFTVSDIYMGEGSHLTLSVASGAVCDIGEITGDSSATVTHPFNGNATVIPVDPQQLPSQQPASQEPAAQQPAAQEPAAQEPAAQEPASQEPASQEPAAQEPASQEPAAQEPAAQEPAAQEPAAQQPAAQEPAAQEPAAQEPAAQEPAAQEPAAQEPASQEPAAQEPAAQEPAAQEPAAQEPAAQEPAAQEPAAQEPASQEPVVEEPIVQEPTAAIPGVAGIGDPVMGNIRGLQTATASRRAGIRTNSTQIYGDVSVNPGEGTLNLGTAAINSLNANHATITVQNSLICAATITLTQTELTGTETAVVTAGDEISIVNSTLDTFRLFGFAEDATGSKTLSLSNVSTSITSVRTLGAHENSQAVVTVNGLNDITLISSSVVSDFPITFFHNNETLSLDTTHYRAQYDSSNTAPTVLGTHTGSGYSTDTQLPSYSPDGYTFKGWLMPGSTTPIGDLKDNVTAAALLTLTTETDANTVQIHWDLGFEPTDLTTNTEIWKTQKVDHSATVDETVAFPNIPTRMGYIFDGWKTHADEWIQPGEQSYTVSYDHLREESDDQGNTSLHLDLTAQWHLNVYDFRLSFKSSQVPIANTEISFDNGKTWQSLTSLDGTATWNNDADDLNISFTPEIQYGESLADYFARLGLSFPVLRDTRDDSKVLAFSGWHTAGNLAVLSTSTFSYNPAASTAMLDSRLSNQSLADYDETLRSGKFLVLPAWGTMSFDLNVPTVSGWAYLVDGVVQTPTDGKIAVPNGATVTFRSALEQASGISRWNLTAGTSRIYLEEHPYVDGASTVDFTFTMPTANVTATYATSADSHYFDLAKAPITFEEQVDHNNLSRDGFWYNYRDEVFTPLFALVNGNKIGLADIDDFSQVTNYFYAWDSSDFYVTSNDVATTNQLTLINAITVYLKECNLIATDAYTRDAKGKKLGSITLYHRSAASESSNIADLSDYGNIVIRNDIHNSYTVSFHIIGENTVTGIFQSSLNVNQSHQATINITGSGKDTSALNLGCMLGNYKTTIKNVRVNGLDDGFDFLMYSADSTLQAAEIMLNGTEIDAPKKSIEVPLGQLRVYTDSKVDLGTVYIGYWIYANTNSYIRIRGNYEGVYFGFNLTENSSAVVDGDMVTNGTWYESNQTINTNGYLIVRGNLMRAGHITMTKGTLIANTLVIDYKSSITGGRIIANQMVNTPKGAFSAGHGYLKDRTAASDMQPFITQQTNRSVPERLYQFNNCEIYLFGYYETTETNGKTYYNRDNWNSEADPMTPWLNAVVDEDGDLKPVSELQSLLASERLQASVADVAIASSTAGSPRECIAFGNSDEDAGVPGAQTITRVKIGNGAQIYAAGNLTFFNETTISAATVVAYGSLRSNRDLIINDGANITATQIGSAWDLTSRDSDGAYRWQKLVLNGGTVRTAMLGSNDQARTTIVTGQTSVIPPEGSSSVQVYEDTRVNYLYDSTFTVTDNKTYDNIRSTGVWDNTGKTCTGMSTTALSFATVNGQWVLGSLQGDVVNKVNTAAQLDDSAQTVAYLQEKISLYAVAASYNLVIKDGLNDIAGITGIQDISSGMVSINRGNLVTIEYRDPAMSDKIVLWYYDASGIMHNVLPEVKPSSRTISFRMPAANVELYITDELPLDLYRYPVTLTKTGFIIEDVSPDTIAQVREDAVFEYRGDLRISQSNIEKVTARNIPSADDSNGKNSQIQITPAAGFSGEETTSNRIIFLEDASFNRTVTLERVVQKIPANTYGVRAHNNADIALKISGVVRLESLSTGGKIDISGENENGISKTTTAQDAVNGKDILFVSPISRSYSSAAIFARNVRFSNIGLLKPRSGIFFSGQASVTLQNVYSTASCYAGELFATNVTKVEIEDSAFDFITADSNSNTLFVRVPEVTFDNSRVDFAFGGTVTSGYPFGSITTLTLTDTQWKLTRRSSTSSAKYLETPVQSSNTPKAIILRGNSVIDSDNRLHLIKVALYDTSRITIRSDITRQSSTYFLCKDVELWDQSAITADYVIISGMIEGGLDSKSTEDDFRKLVETGKNIVSYGTLTVNGGTLTATKFLGGAGHATINVKGGTVTAPAIGSDTTVFGIAGIIPTVNEEFVYRYDNALTPSQTRSTINISGGKVNVAADGYLGGHNSTVTVTGGEVNLGQNATLGLTNDQLTAARLDATAHGQIPADTIKVKITISGGKVEGAIDENGAVIQAPYGTIAISGTQTAVRTAYIRAEEGTITIKHAQGAYPSPTGYQYQVMHGVWAEQRLLARQINISDQAMVYAGIAQASIPKDQTGGISINSNTSDARLYVRSFGASGEGADDNSLQVITAGGPDGNQNVFLQNRIVPIRYHLMDDSLDPAVNATENPATYIQTATTEYQHLAAPSRFGYKFNGWYLDPELTDGPHDRLLKTNDKPVNLYAKWTPRNITVEVVIHPHDPDDPTKPNIDGLANEVIGKADGPDGDGIYTYTTQFVVPYRSTIQQIVKLAQLDLKSYRVDGIAVDIETYAKNNETMQSDATIDDELLRAYEAYLEKLGNAEKPLRLRVSGVYKGSELITFVLRESYAKDAKFHTQGNTEQTAAGQVMSYVEYDHPLSEGKGFGSGESFISASAPGYQFLGWSSNPNPTGAEHVILSSHILKAGDPLIYYAVWVPKTYTIELQAQGATITSSTATWQDSGTITKTYNSSLGILPTASDPSRVFKGWLYNGQSVKTTDMLTLAKFPALKESASAGEIALTFTADFRDVVVTYDLQGGQWTQDDMKNEDMPKYGDALRGYTKNVAEDTEQQYELIKTHTVEGNTTTYSIVSTTAVGFTDGTYAENDYRHILGRNGYTFAGWFTERDGGGVEVYTIRPGEDITLYAHWTPNTYHLELHAYDVAAYQNKESNNYKYSIFHNDYLYENGNPIPDKALHKATLTVGKEITPNTGNDSNDEVWTIQWPDRTGADSDWYVYSPADTSSDGTLEDSDKRYLLGFTFAPLYPGSRNATGEGNKIYTDYAAIVTQLINNDLLLREGESTFFLPESFGYQNVTNINEIKDYPNGSTMPLYAVYRERSLVFIETYTDAEGIHDREKTAVPYQEWSSYPYETDDSKPHYTVNSEWVSKGYSQLRDWYALDRVPNSNNIYPHTAEEYTSTKREQFLAAASNTGTYDIPVYAVYVAQEECDYPLSASAVATKTTRDSAIEHLIPASMTPDAMNYQITQSAGLTLVTKEEIDAHRFDPVYSEKKAAIVWTLVDPSGIPRQTGCLETSGTIPMGDLAVSPGWKIRLELYTANVLSDDTLYDLDIRFGFQSAALASQCILMDLAVDLNPTQYSVTYDANLPDTGGEPLISGGNYVADGQSDGKWTTTVNYGANLTDAVPRVRGYNATGVWTQTDSNGTPKTVQKAFGAPLDVAVSAADNGHLYFQTDWNVNEYSFSVSAEVMDHWNVKITEWNFKTGEYESTSETYTKANAIPDKLPYRAKIEFVSIGNNPANFVKIIQTSGTDNDTDSTSVKTLFDYVNTNTPLTMKDGPIDVSYEDVRTLYLEDGTIDIVNKNNKNGYTQNGTFVDWPGDYVILMDDHNNEGDSGTEAETLNRLILDGDLSNRQITLGNLNITSENSIDLKSGTAKLTAFYANDESTIQVENICVQTNARLTLDQGSFTLTPEAHDSTTPSVAIGGNYTGNAVELKNATVTITLPASTNSVPGIGAQTISLEGTAVTVTQNASSVANFDSAWIGGKDTSLITLNNTTVKQGTNSAGHQSSYALYAGKGSIKLTDSSVGTETEGVNPPIKAKDDLTLVRSHIYQSVQDMIKDRPISAGGDILVGKDSTIYVDNNASWPDSDKEVLYDGVMKIRHADSQVNIANTLILEMNNGDVSITENSVTQDRETHSNFTGNYLLLEELLTDSTKNPNLTVNSISGSVTVQEATNSTIGAFRLNELDVFDSFTVKLAEDTNLNVTTMDIHDVTLTMDGSKDGTVTLAENALATATGIYVQNNGELKSTDSIQGNNLDILLDGVTVAAEDLIAKNLTLTDSEVTCTNGQVGSIGAADAVTKVILEGSKVTAATVGALGTQNTTFTFVEMDSSSTVTGSLVQDHYRIAYDVDASVGPPAYTVFRSITTDSGQTAVGGDIPATPTSMSNFAVWYYKDGTDMYAVSTSPVAGYSGYSPLTADLLQFAEAPAVDGTQTLTLYAGMKITLTASLKDGRLFNKFNDGANAISIPANSAWTAYLTVAGTVIPNSDYQLVFTDPLPQGTRLTLTELDEQGTAIKAYYYLVVSQSDMKVVKLRDFTPMGGSGEANIPDVSAGNVGNPNTEHLLLAADFVGASDAASSNSFQFQCIVKQNSAETVIAQFEGLSYDLTTVDGSVVAAAGTDGKSGTVNVIVSSNSIYAGKSYSLVAEIRKTDDSLTVSPKAWIKLGDSMGKSIGGNQYVFDNSITSGSFSYTLDGFYGKFTIIWKLMLKQDGTNVLGTQIAASTAVSYTVSEPAAPALSVTLSEGQSHTLYKKANGNGTEIAMSYTTNAEKISVEIGKQSSAFASFSTVSGTKREITVPAEPDNRTISVTIPNEVGVYRVCISMDETSTNDNVYHTFVVVDETAAQ